jgi:tryptophan-rich sensory protein
VREIASRGQLRAGFLRWAIVTVPFILLLGFGAGRLAPSGDANPWYAALTKPAIVPPGWAFPVAWTIIYILLGLALALILNARGAPRRSLALTAFAVQMALNLVWAPLFFGAHLVSTALLVIVAMFFAALVTTFLFGRIRSAAAWLMAPYLVWLLFAGYLNYQIDRLNPDAEALVPSRSTTQIQL